MRRELRLGQLALRPARRMGLSAAILALALSGCTVIQGDTASLDKVNAAPVPLPAPAADDMLAGNRYDNGSIASAGIPIPLMSPRNRDVLVASIDPRAGISEISRGMPLSRIADPYFKFDKAINIAETSKLNSPKEVRRVLKTLRFSQPETLADGWYAARAMTAANTAVFAKGVRNELRIHGEAKLLGSLNDPEYVMRMPGADAAISAVMVSAQTEDARLSKLRKRFIDTAFKFQKQKWGMITPLAAEPETKAAEVTSPTEILRKTLATLSPISEAHAYSYNVMAKILARGAREIMSAPIVPISGGKDETTSCLNWARLNLNQCVAAAHFPSEEAWCTGTHAVEDIRACWSAALPGTH
tara:strand:+ start:240197 stop:241270 length:1074 start_codon:yes stop_codon:yes gene_type:complete